MIVDFTIENFRSIRSKQTFSMYVESSSKHLCENFKDFEGELSVLKTAGIYGANASGKSNWLLAFYALRYLICYSGDLKDGENIACYEPFLLSDKTRNAPIKFEMEFILQDQKRYIYKIAFDQCKVISESLDFFPSSTIARLFKRKKNDTWENLSFGRYLKGGRRKIPFFDNNSYLSKAGNTADSPKFIRDIFNFFRMDIVHLGPEKNLGVVINWKRHRKVAESVAEILSKVDTGISGLRFEEKDTSNISIPDTIPNNIKADILEAESFKTLFLHRGRDGVVQELGEEMESSGTVKLYNLLPLIIDCLTDGGVILLDELDNSFHPHIAEMLIKLFNDPKVNTKHSQLIFTTHNMSLMDPEILRRDQVWLTEKSDGETKLISLEDFDKNVVKMDSPFNKWYGDGRFGAIPKIDIPAVKRVILDK